jgi:hypothetical protein
MLLPPPTATVVVVDPARAAVENVACAAGQVYFRLVAIA